MIASFSLACLWPRRENVTQWSNYLTQRAEILTQRCLTPQRAKNSVNDLPVVPKLHAFDIKQVGFTPSSLFSRDQQAAVSSLLQMETFLPNTTAAECSEKNDLHEVGLYRRLAKA